MEKVISLFGMNLSPKAGAPSQWHHHVEGNDSPQIVDEQRNASIVNGNGHGACYFYDEKEQLTKVLYPDGSSQAFAYDRHGNLSWRKTAQGRLLNYAYDQHQRLHSIADDQGERVTYDYGPHATRLVNSACTTEIVYDEEKRPICVRQTIDGVTFRIDYEYDAAGRCVGIRPPGSTQWLRYDYDEKNQSLHIHAENGQSYVTLSTDEVRFANGVREYRHLDREGKIDQIIASNADDRLVMDLRYCFNEQWQIAQINERRFVYDVEGRLAECFDESGNHTRYIYDAYGNRLTEESPFGAVHYAYDECERLLRITLPDAWSIDYLYDRDGNRTGRQNGQHCSEYRYDAEGRLTEVWKAGSRVAQYAYDALGRRIRKEVGDEVTIFHYDGNGQLLAETDELGQARATYLWAGLRCLGRINGPAGETASDFYHNDHLGSVQAVTDRTSAISWKHDGNVFGKNAGPFFARKRRDDETGFYDFGARFYDPESGRFLTPDNYTFGPDDWRLLFDPGRDFWGERKPWPHAAQQGRNLLQSSNRYAFCLNDPVNHLDLDGHNAAWFFLTIPSSLTWALPNTAIGLLMVVGNILMEILGWVIWFFICVFKWDRTIKHYPWGNINPSNPFDKDERAHIWFGLQASARLGVPWALLNGSFFVWRPYTLGNIIYVDSSYDNGLRRDTDSRFVVPNDPDVQLTTIEALYNHEMQHVFQYAYLGPLFHCLPIPPLGRLIGSDKWWERINLGGLSWTVGLLIHFLSFKSIKSEDIQKWINPKTWWSHILPSKWVKLVSNAWNMKNWLPFVGVYEWDSKFFFDQHNSWFERNAGANSGDVYQTLVKAEKTEIYVGEFTRVVGADRVLQVTPGRTTNEVVVYVFFTIDPQIPDLFPDQPPHKINFDAEGTPVQVVNASGFYFQSFEAKTFTVKGHGSQSNHKDTVTIKVKDIDVEVNTNVFVCQDQFIRVDGDSNATYSIGFKSNKSCGAIDGMTYTAGNTPGKDTIEVVANYSPTSGVFSKYGDNGLADNGYALKVIDINVKEPKITPDTVEVFVGGIVTFTMDQPPKKGESTTNVSGSQFNLATRQFIAGRGPISTDTIETVTLDYGCGYSKHIKITVKPITATIAPAIVDGGGTAQINVSGGVSPFKYMVSDPQSTGPEVDANGRYIAGSKNTQVIDTITITDRNGEGGRAVVKVKVRPMTAAANPTTVPVNGTAQVTASSGVSPFTFAITNRESTGSTINTNGQYRAGTTPGIDTITVTDRKGTRVTVTITVT
jgi:RHS repeat-associated protein